MKNERQTSRYRTWKKKVLERDGYKCQNCGAWNKSVKLQVHHIFKWHLYPKFRYDIRNGIVLCANCHKQYDENQSIIWQIKYRKLKEKYNKLKELYEKSN